MTNFLVSAALVKDEEPGLCVLVPRDVSRTSGGVYEWWDDSAQMTVELPETGVFQDTTQVGLLQLGGLLDPTVQELGGLLDAQLGSLLSCVYGGWFESGIQPPAKLTDWSSWPPHDEAGSLLPLAHHKDRMKFVIATGHGSAADGTVGGLTVADFGVVLDDLGCEELLLLTCRGGCPGISEGLSSAQRIVISPSRTVDPRKAYIFATYYIWKRFGEGWSASQATGAQPVSGNHFQLWHAGRAI